MISYKKIVFGASDKDDEAAISDYSDAILINKKLPQAFMERGIRYMKIKNYDKAYFDYSETLKINNLSEELREKAFLYRGISNIFLKKPNLNSKELQIMHDEFLITEIYDSKERRYLLGLIFSVNEKYNSAIKYFKSIILEDPGFFKNNNDFYDFLPLEAKLLLKSELNI